MANETMVLLEKIVVPSGGASSVTFTSIPQSYTDLVVKLSTRTDQGSGPDYVYLQFNGNTSTSNYQGIFLRGNGSTVASSSNTAEGKIRAAITTTSGETASTFSNCEIYIPNYTSSNNKSTSSDWVPENNATATFMGITAGLWTQTSAITSINLAPSSGLFVQYSTFYLYGVAKQGVTPTNAPAATGGDRIVFDGTYWYHVFTSTGTFTPKKGLTCDYLVVAGGGGSGGGASGGGGAGGVRSTVTSTGRGGSLESPLSLTASTNYTVTIGAGGTAGTTDGSSGGPGGDSVFASITSAGGGKGVHGNLDVPGSGGAGGGAGYKSGGTTTGGSGTTGQGYDGGSATNSGSPYFTGGGGGGAGAAGGSVNASYTSGAGGNGIWTALTNAVSMGQLSGGNYYVAGGGAGGTASGTVSGGLGGGGSSTDNANGVAGTVNTGGGAGGAGTDSTKSGATGGSGIVIVRYAA